MLGRTGLNVSIFGFGGIVVTNSDKKEADAIVAEAVDRGINYFDVAPGYGNAQDMLGPALEPYRDQVVLACKTAKRTKDEALKELRDSLKKLKTDYFDIYQLHGIDSEEDLKTALGPDGALEAFIKAKEEGLIKYLGFSCHREESALYLMEQYDFDTVVFPINWIYWLKAGIGHNVLNAAMERNMGRIAIKGLAQRKWEENEERDCPKCWYKPISEDFKLAELALRFTLSQSVHVALSPGDSKMLRIGMDIVDNYTEVKPEEIAELEKRMDGINPIF